MRMRGWAASAARISLTTLRGASGRLSSGAALAVVVELAVSADRLDREALRRLRAESPSSRVSR